MQLVRQIQFKASQLFDDLSIRSKNLFNVATYVVRQRFFEDRHWIRYNELWKLLKKYNNYTKLEELARSHPPQQVLKQVDAIFNSFFKAIKAYTKDASKFLEKPNLPYYKPKNGKNIVYFTSLQVRNKEGYVLLTRKLEKLGFPNLITDLQNVKGVLNSFKKSSKIYSFLILIRHRCSSAIISPKNGKNIVYFTSLQVRNK